MTDSNIRAQVINDYRDYKQVMQRHRTTGITTECFDHFHDWDWQEFEYYTTDCETPVVALRKEVDQACRDGEAVIMSQDAGKLLLKYLENRA